MLALKQGTISAHFWGFILEPAAKLSKVLGHKGLLIGICGKKRPSQGDLGRKTSLREVYQLWLTVNAAHSIWTIYPACF